MREINTTLKPSVNIIMIVLWGLIASYFAYRSIPFSYLIVSIAIILGLVCGTMQTLSFNERKESFLEYRTMMDVRRKLKNTKWGKRYIYFLWISNLVLVIFVILGNKGDLMAEVVAGVFALMFVREIVTLKPTFELARFNKKGPEPPTIQGLGG